MTSRLPRRRADTKALAKELRSNMTPAERQLWSLVRAHRLAGLKFHRQFPAGPYIADFYCPERKLILEIDGESHDVRVEHDARRTEYLQEHGLKVLRISNEDVLSNLENVGIAILNACGIDPRPWMEGRCRIPPSP